MKPLLLIFISLVLSYICNAQFSCSTQGFSSSLPSNLRTAGTCEKKVIRINIHYMLKTDGTGNFNETGDGLGGTLNGYQHAVNIVNYANGTQRSNNQLSIPPNNTVPVNPKNFEFILDAVYYHRNTTTFLYSNSSNVLTGLLQNGATVINVFYSGGTNSEAYASNLDVNSKIKYTEMGNIWERYKSFTQNPTTDYYEWVMGGAAKGLCHEIGHLLGLSHTVMYNYGVACPTVANGQVVDNSCDDGCADTPTAWSIMDNLNSGTHPACGWGDDEERNKN